MRRSYIYIAVALLLCAVICGCGGGDRLPLFEEYVLCVEEPSRYSVNIRYQRIANTEKNSIFADIEEQNYQNSFDGYVVEPMSVETSAQLLSDEYIEAEAEGYRYSMEQTAHLVRDEKILCYETFVESYTGGMHDSYSLWYECFDLDTGRLYDFEYLFEGEWGETFRKLIIDCLKADGVDLLIDSAEMLPVADSVLITDSGLILVYQPYTIASFDAGIISLSLPDADIAATGAPLLWVKEAQD